MQLQEKDALIVVDVQRDFLPGGALAVSDGDAVVPPLNVSLRRFHDAGLAIFATRDWHPADHCSFAANGGPWPPHCVQDTAGAGFADDLELPSETVVVSKATRTDADAYSGFDGTDLEDRLRDIGARRVFVGGLATDYCVLATVRDAVDAGFDVVLLADAVRAVNVEPGDGEKAIGEMRHLGVSMTDAAGIEADG